MKLRSLAQLSAELRIDYHRLARVADVGGIAPAKVEDGVRQFDERGVARMLAAIVTETSPSHVERRYIA